VPLAGRPMIEWSIDALRACGRVRSIVVAAPPGHDHELEDQDLDVVSGGATRAESVANALAARPLLAPVLLDDLLARLDADPEAAGVIAATPVPDTIKQAQEPDLAVQRTVDRSRLWAAQTPQVFRAAVLRAALEVGPEVRDAATDEAMLVEGAGGRVLIHPTSPQNLKVTTPLDLRLAELLLEERRLSP
jgi:2-C-methyl-D-erythritol 4-phosphate cytidylyltransferase